MTTERAPRRGVRGHAVRLSIGAAYGLAWGLCALVAMAALFLQSSRTTTLASHDVVLQPTLDGDVVVHSGPVLPDLRLDIDSPLGISVRLGKTDAGSTQELVQRYAVLASQPRGVEAKLRTVLTDMAVDAALRGAALGLLPVLVWVLPGGERRRQLLRRLPTPQGGLAVLLVGLLLVGLWRPWDDGEETLDEGREWVPLGDFLGPQVPLPEGVEDVQVRGDVTTSGTRRLIESAVDTYEESKTFYAEAAEAAAELPLRVPDTDQTSVVLVSDRHDNIGMDQVARAIADRAGATGVFDAGDDTSTGSPWEAFSLDSITAAFEDRDRWGVTGNHDHGDFVGDYLADAGWTMLDGEVVEGPGGTRLLGVPDPRQSGLGSWRDVVGLSFAEVEAQVADTACAAQEEGERIGTILVHDANLGREALARGCTDLVLGGHLHEQVGPDRVVGDNGLVGYTYTNGTTGGAAYAIALGSKPRRPAQVTVVTYGPQGRPVGLQPVTLRPSGRYRVSPYLELELGPETVDADPDPDLDPELHPPESLLGDAGAVSRGRQDRGAGVSPGDRGAPARGQVRG